MTRTQHTKLLHKAISMELIKNQLSITLTKSELLSVITEALQDESASTAIKRALAPVLATAFPQFPEHTNVTLANTDENGATTVILRKPVTRTTQQAPLSDAEVEVEDTAEEATSDL